MDHTYDFFGKGIEEGSLVELESTLKEQDELMAKLLSASDFLCMDDVENAEEVLADVFCVTEEKIEE